MRYYDKAFSDAARKLRKEVPLGVPLRIQTSKTIKNTEESVLADCTDYYCEGRLAGFRIRVLRGQSLDSAIDCLIHEYAHALDREHRPNSRIDHGDSWGRLYAKCYQVVMGRH
jgi:hypothetical protein